MLITDRWFPLKALFWSIGSAEANIENEAVMHNPSSQAFGIPHTTELIFQVEWSIWSDGPIFGAVRHIFTDIEGNISIERKRSRYPTFTRKKKTEMQAELARCNHFSCSTSCHVSDRAV